MASYAENVSIWWRHYVWPGTHCTNDAWTHRPNLYPSCHATAAELSSHVQNYHLIGSLFAKSGQKHSSYIYLKYGLINRVSSGFSWRLCMRFMMTSSTGNIFCVTGHLWGESTGDRWPHKGQWRMALMFSFICAWSIGWANNRDAGDLRRRRAHYDITLTIASNLRLINVD